MNKKKKENTLSQPHARTFEYVFREKETVVSLLKEYLPEKIRNKLDFNSLRISNTKLVDKKLEDYFSDLLYEINLKSGHKSFIYLLFEHKSQKERFIFLQLLKYMVRIWELFLKQNKKVKYLPVIIPLVIYHGKPKWNLTKGFISLFEDPTDLEEYIPDFSFNLYDISHMPDDNIQGTPLLKIFLTTFKYIYSPELRSKLWEIFKLFLELSDKTKMSEYLEVLLRYLFNSPGELNKEELREQVANILEDGGDIMQTIAQQLREEGIKIGEEKGIKIGEVKGIKIGEEKGIKIGEEKGIKIGEEKGIKIGEESKAKETARKMLEDGLPIETIVKYTGLTKQEVKELLN
jgi:predicted transposase/invertase (TIGR01784 family)